MIETVIIIVVLLIIVGLILYAIDRVAFPGPTGPMIKMVLIIAVCLIAALYLAQRFL